MLSSILDVIRMWPFIRSQRRAPLIIHEGFVYRCERKIDRKTYWLCIRYKGQKCRARLIIDGNVLVKHTAHQHEVDSRSESTNVIEHKNLEDDDIEEWIKGSKEINK